MTGLFEALAGLVVLGHLAFVVFVAAGALLALRWRRLVWIHVPAMAWAAYIEFASAICPLTPLENRLRTRVGLDDYSGDFVARYLFPMLYPEGLTRNAQIVLGLAAVTLNIGVYACVYNRRRRRDGGTP